MASISLPTQHIEHRVSIPHTNNLPTHVFSSFMPSWKENGHSGHAKNSASRFEPNQDVDESVLSPKLVRQMATPIDFQISHMDD
jgi:hypothetical protein